MSSNGSFEERYKRYLPIIETLAISECIDIEETRAAFEKADSIIVTRTIKELVSQGWLVQEGSEAGSVYRWNPGKGEFQTRKWLDQKIFGSQIKASPVNARPREKLLEQGAENLSVAELVAILVRSGRPGESAVAAGEKVAREYDGKIAELVNAGRGELKLVSPAIDKTAYCQIMAGIELGRRVAAESDSQISFKIMSTSDAIQYCQRKFARLITDAQQEEFHIVTLNTRNQVFDTHQITVGTLDSSLVHPREVFRAAIRDAASSIILVHNHPSGDPTPSPQDFAVTDRLTESGKTLGIDVLDHIVLGNPDSISIREYRGR